MLAAYLVGAPSPGQGQQGSFAALKPKVVNQNACFFLREKNDSEPGPQQGKDDKVRELAGKWSAGCHQGGLPGPNRACPALPVSQPQAEVWQGPWAPKKLASVPKLFESAISHTH